MPLETGTQIGDLDPANPPGTDPLSQADDHLRLIKTCVQGSLGDMEALWAIPTNNTPLRARNAADDAYIDLINLTAADRITVPGDLTVTGTVDIKAGTENFPITAVSTDQFAHMVLADSIGSAAVQMDGGVIRLLTGGDASSTTAANSLTGLQIDTSQNVNITDGDLTCFSHLNMKNGKLIRWEKADSSLTDILQLFTDDNVYMDSPGSTQFRTNGDSPALTLTTGQKAIFADDVTATGTGTFQSGFISLSVGADSDAITLTDATPKLSRIATPHYTNAELPVAMLHCNAGLNANILYQGGGTALMNSATEIRMYTAANTTTNTGTHQITCDGNGNFNILHGNLSVEEGDLIVGLVKSNEATGSLVMSGGTTSSLGGVISLRGQSHSSQASDIVFLSAGSTVGKYDFSQTTWVFNEDVDIDAQCIIRNDEGKLEVNHTEAGGEPVINLKLTGTTKCYWQYLTSTSTVKFSNNSGKAFKFIDNFGQDVMALDSGGKMTIKDLAGTGTKSLLVDENGLIFRGP